MGTAVHRQRPPRVLRAPADAAHDQHLHAAPARTIPAEIIASVKKGIYAVNFGGGQVDITSGKFVFSASRPTSSRTAAITAPGQGRHADRQRPRRADAVSMVGNDLELDAGVGTCGKEGQSVPVGVGQPTLRIDGLTVGGTVLHRLLRGHRRRTRRRWWRARRDRRRRGCASRGVLGRPLANSTHCSSCDRREHVLAFTVSRSALKAAIIAVSHSVLIRRGVPPV
jgi:hypothetical protein